MLGGAADGRLRRGSNKRHVRVEASSAREGRIPWQQQQLCHNEAKRKAKVSMNNRACVCVGCDTDVTACRRVFPTVKQELKQFIPLSFKPEFPFLRD